MTDLTKVLEDVVQIFERLGTPYALMGGFAVRIYGIPRPTHDIDFTIAIDRGRLPELFRAATESGYTVPEAYSQGWVDQVAGLPLVKIRLYLEEKGIDIDIFLAESRFQEELLSRRRQEHLNGLSVFFVSPEDLILLKLLAGRPRDFADIGDVIFTQAILDVAYMRLWASELGVLQKLEDVLQEPPLI